MNVSFLVSRLRARSFCALVFFPLAISSGSAATVGYWRFESGAFLTDTGGNSAGPFNLTNDGGNNNNDAIVLPATGAGSSIWRTVPLTLAPNGGAALFTASETPPDGFTVAHNAAFNSSAFTIEAVINLASMPGVDESRTIASEYGVSFTDRRFRLSITGTSSTDATQKAGAIRFSFAGVRGGTNTTFTEYFTGLIITPGQDYYVSVTCALVSGGVQVSARMKNLTTNEAQVITTDNRPTSENWASLNTTTSPFRIGAATGNTGELPWDGMIDEVRFSNTALVRSDMLFVPLPPTIAVQPTSQTVPVGAVAAFSVEANSITPPTYQWYTNSTPFPESGTSANLALRGSAAGTFGYYNCVVSNEGGSALSDLVTLTLVNTSDPGTLSALSIRGQVGAGDSVLIAGIITERSTVKALVQAVGPTLGVRSPDIANAVLKNPKLELYQFKGGAFTKNSENDDWANPSSGAAALSSAEVSGGATRLTDTASRDSALLSTLSPGIYTANVSGVLDTTGIALVEVYAVPSVTDTGALSALSIRGRVGTGGDVMIAGIIVGGSTAKTVLIQAVGPTLGVTSPDIAGSVLTNPKLELYKLVNGSFVKFHENDDWGGDATIAYEQIASGATSLTNAASKDSALLVTLPPGVYTANVSGVNNTSGVVLIQAYAVP